MGKYINIWVVFFISLLVPIGKSHAQLNPERIAWNRLQAGKWESAHRLLKKSLRKDSTNLEAIYVLSNWFFAKSNPDLQIDSAYHYIHKSIKNYDTLSLRDKERVLKFPIDSLILRNLREKIDNVAFERAKQKNTESGYIQFIQSFLTAAQVNSAIELRDEVSFLEALKINTYESFRAYLVRYPQSHRAGDATDRYEKLLFEEKTKSKRLSNFKSFLKEYPASPYAGEAHRQVFEIATASGEPEDFIIFLKEYPSGKHEKFVHDILFHIYEEREEAIPVSMLTDSLKHVKELNSRFWIPFLKNGLFGFMDQTGAEVLPPLFHDVRDEYKCGTIMDDILSLPDGYFSRTGKKIASYTASLHSIGSGFLSIDERDCLQLIHKSGRVIIADCYETYKMIDDNFIAARQNGYYTLYTLAGRKIVLPGITQVSAAEGLIILTISEKKIINTVKQLAALADGNSFHNELVFDEVLVVDKNLLLVRNSGLEGILDTNLQYVIPLGRHTLTKTSFGLIENQNGRSSIHGLSPELESKSFDEIRYYQNWLVLRDILTIQLFDLPSKKMIEANADSVWFERNLAFVKRANTKKVYLSATHSIDLQPESKINFIASRDSVQFFFTENKKKRTVFSLRKGDRILVTEFDLIESLGTDYFIVSKGTRKGVIDRNGKPVVPVEMDAIILTDKNHLSLLKDKKFGLYDLRERKYFKPVYERNLFPLDKKNLVVYKDGFYGVMNLYAKTVTEFEFSEIQAWTDSVIWVKKDFQWRLLNYFTQEVILDRVKDFSWINNTQEERIARIHRENYYGIMSNLKGAVVQASFTDIINLGTADQPFYFTEKQVEEAGIFVVVYFDKHGKLVRRHAYEEEEYERILCEDH